MDVGPETVPLLDLNKLLNSSRFMTAAETEDELGCVLRIHLCLESFLEEFLKNFVQADHKKYHKDRLSFSEKLSLAVAYDLPLSIAEPIQVVNRLRNRCAHAGDSPLESQLANMLADQVDLIEFPGKDNKFTVKKTYVEFCVGRPGEKLKFGENGPRIDFLLVSSYLLANASRWLVTEYMNRFPCAMVHDAALNTAEGHIPC